MATPGDWEPGDLGAYGYVGGDHWKSIDEGPHWDAYDADVWARVYVSDEVGWKTVYSPPDWEDDGHWDDVVDALGERYGGGGAE